MTAETGLRPRARLGAGAAVLLVLAALAVTVGIGVWRGMSSPVEEIVVATPSPSPSGAMVEAAALYVHVSGAVAEPGLYVLEPGARVVDAVAAAGGLVDDADASAVNLARPLADGEQLGVPLIGEQLPAGEGTGAAPGAGGSGGGLVNINTADQAQLETLPRIGPALAQRILEWREQNGAFSAVDDLLAVSGIGDKMLETLRDLVTV